MRQGFLSATLVLFNFGRQLVRNAGKRILLIHGYKRNTSANHSAAIRSIFFDYLSKKKIAEIFCDHIDKDIKLAEKAAHIFCKSGIKEAGEYVNAELRRRQQ